MEHTITSWVGVGLIVSVDGLALWTAPSCLAGSSAGAGASVGAGAGVTGTALEPVAGFEGGL